MSNIIKNLESYKMNMTKLTYNDTEWNSNTRFCILRNSVLLTDPVDKSYKYISDYVITESPNVNVVDVFYKIRYYVKTSLNINTSYDLKLPFWFDRFLSISCQRDSRNPSNNSINATTTINSDFSGIKLHTYNTVAGEYVFTIHVKALIFK